MDRINPKVAMIIAAVLALLLLLYVFAGGEKRSGNPDRLSDGAAREDAAAETDERCSSPRTNELIKAELFRQAAELRGRDGEALARIATSSLLRLESAEVESEDGDTGALSCTASMVLDLPPGLAVAGGRHSLPDEASYVLQPGDNNLALTGAEEIVTPLATIARSGQVSQEVVNTQEGVTPPTNAIPGEVAPAPPPRVTTTPERRPPPPPARTPPPPPPPRATPAPPPARTTASPSFNCRNARTRGEVAVCSNGSLASLDRQMASQFYRARSAANPRQRALLERTRGNFLRFRDSCGSEACMAGAYRDRIREINDIMNDRWNP